MTTKGIIFSVINLSMPAVAWLAVHGNGPAGNIIKLFVGVSAALALLVPLVIVAEKQEPKPMAEALSHISDALSVAILTWHGWLWCAAGLTLGWFGAFVIFSARKCNLEARLKRERRVIGDQPR